MTRHKKPVDRWANGHAGEPVMLPKNGVRLVPSVSKNAEKAGEMAILRRLLMLGAMRDGAGVGHLAKMRLILGKVGGMCAAAPSPNGQAARKRRSKYEA